jgi:hypothetical protein
MLRLLDIAHYTKSGLNMRIILLRHFERSETSGFYDGESRFFAAIRMTYYQHVQTGSGITRTSTPFTRNGQLRTKKALKWMRNIPTGKPGQEDNVHRQDPTRKWFHCISSFARYGKE